MSEGVGKGVVSITPSDTDNIDKNWCNNFPRAVRFGTGGECVIVATDGTDVTLTNIADGETIECNIKRINSTGLSGCSDIVGFY